MRTFGEDRSGVDTERLCPGEQSSLRCHDSLDLDPSPLHPRNSDYRCRSPAHRDATRWAVRPRRRQTARSGSDAAPPIGECRRPAGWDQAGLASL